MRSLCIGLLSGGLELRGSVYSWRERPLNGTLAAPEAIGGGLESVDAVRVAGDDRPGALRDILKRVAQRCGDGEGDGLVALRVDNDNLRPALQLQCLNDGETERH